MIVQSARDKHSVLEAWPCDVPQVRDLHLYVRDSDQQLVHFLVHNFDR